MNINGLATTIATKAVAAGRKISAGAKSAAWVASVYGNHIATGARRGARVVGTAMKTGALKFGRSVSAASRSVAKNIYSKASTGKAKLARSVRAVKFRATARKITKQTKKNAVRSLKSARLINGNRIYEAANPKLGHGFTNAIKKGYARTLARRNTKHGLDIMNPSTVARMGKATKKATRHTKTVMFMSGAAATSMGGIVVGRKKGNK